MSENEIEEGTKLNLFRKILFIDNDKKWWKELFEWFLVTLIFFFIASAYALIKGISSFPEHFNNFINEFGFVFSILTIGVKLIYNFFSTFKKSLVKVVDDKLSNDVVKINSKVNDISTQIDKYLKQSKIVFKAGIKEFDNNHLLAIQRILNALEDNATDIFAIDNSDPIQWWSDTMTGYLALLAKWKALDSNNKRRQVTRIFVYPKNELLSPVLAKTVTLHSLMGFKTFVFSKKMYDSIFDKFKPDSRLIHQKEVVVWANISNEEKEGGGGTEEKSEIIDIDFNLDERDWHKVRCYQSFWDMDMDRNARNENMKNCHPWKNYYDEIIDSSLIDIWFEFIAYEKENEAHNEITKKKKKYWEEIPQQHLQFIKELKDNSICCKNANEVKQIDNSEPYGLEVKTSSCSECGKKCMNSTENINGTKFDFTSGIDVKEMLKEYYNKINI